MWRNDATAADVRILVERAVDGPRRGWATFAFCLPLYGGNLWTTLARSGPPLTSPVSLPIPNDTVMEATGSFVRTAHPEKRIGDATGVPVHWMPTKAEAQATGVASLPYCNACHTAANRRKYAESDAAVGAGDALEDNGGPATVPPPASRTRLALGVDGARLLRALARSALTLAPFVDAGTGRSTWRVAR